MNNFRIEGCIDLAFSFSIFISSIDNVGKIVPLRRMKQYCCVGVNRTATSE